VRGQKGERAEGEESRRGRGRRNEGKGRKVEPGLSPYF